MKTSTVLASMLAGAAACALATAPALASPSIHVTGVSNHPLHFKTNTTARAPHLASTFTSTVNITGSVSSSFSGLLYAYTWYTQTSGGKCVQPKKQKQKYKKVKNGTVVPGSTTSTNPCGTGNFKYFGPIYTAGNPGRSSFKGTLTAKNFYGYHLILKENVSLNVT